ncbi:MAG: hypothetical protein CBB71_09300 [Rhodopirellula sp. TMED11]|nr:MAG: hypothetical protein CBB71_09300 [Rhodopirellula sp. TMED11]
MFPAGKFFVSPLAGNSLSFGRNVHNPGGPTLTGETQLSYPQTSDCVSLPNNASLAAQMRQSQ